MKSIANLYIILLLGLLFLSCKDDNKTLPIVYENYDKAFEFREKAVLDSAFYYFNLAKEDFTADQDNFGTGKCLINMSQILLGASDFYSAQELALQAISYFDEKNPEHFHFIATNYNTLGGASFNLNEFDTAITFFLKALKFAAEPSEQVVYMNNLAKVYNEVEDYDSALEIYSEILQISNLDSVTYARVLTNFANTSNLAGQKDEVLNLLKQSFSIRKRLKDKWGLNSSYEHLSQYFSFQKDSATFYANQMLFSAIGLSSLELQIDAYKRLIQVGPADSSSFYFQQHENLNDSLSLIRNKAKNQFALIIYEVEKEKAESEKKSLQLFIQRIFFAALLLVIVLISYFLIHTQKRRNTLLKLEAAHSINEIQLKTSKKIHDVIANGIYRVMSTLESDPNFNRVKILDELENMYEKSRDISHEEDSKGESVKFLSAQEFATEIGDLLKSFSHENRQILIAGNEHIIWENLSSEYYFEIYHIVQEWLVNMAKHSQASRVIMKFRRDENSLQLFYVDNGKGIEDLALSKGKGWQNTENRINNLKGLLNFESDLENGLKIELSIPLK